MKSSAMVVDSPLSRDRDYNLRVDCLASQRHPGSSIVSGMLRFLETRDGANGTRSLDQPPF